MRTHALTFLMLLSVCAPAAFGYSGGGGTPADPYQIANKDDLLQLAATTADYGSSFILTANIDLAGRTFTQSPIAYGDAFSGVFDGGSYAISNLTINATYSNNGLFGVTDVSAIIRCLRVVNVKVTAGSTADQCGGIVGWNYGSVQNCSSTGTISGRAYQGGIVGRNQGGSIVHCWSNATVSGLTADIGGLVGASFNGSISESYATGNVSGEYNLGGLVGRSQYAYISNCYATGSVTGISGGQSWGGLVGDYEDYGGGSLRYCYSTGSVNGTTYSGGLIGYSSGTATSCFWDIQTSGQTTSKGGTGKTTAQMQTLGTFTSAGWDFVGETMNGLDDYWQILAGDYPTIAVATRVYTPAFTPDAGTYNGEQYVIVTCNMPDVSIHYTTNGVDPTESDPTVASGASVLVGHSMPLKAKAWKTGLTSSPVKSAYYTIVVAAPALSIWDGTYNSEQNVVVTCATAGATIHCTTNGIDPTESDPVVASGSSVYVDHSLTLKAKAWKAGLTPSAVESAAYTIVVATPVFTPGGSTYGAQQNVVITCATPGATIHYTTTGVDPTESDPVVVSDRSVYVDHTMTLKARAWKGTMASAVQSGTYTIILTPLPPAPSGVSATDGSLTGKVRVTWNSVAQADGYEIWWSLTNNSGTATKMGTITGSANTTFDDATAIAGVVYWYWVKAFNLAGYSECSSSDSGYASILANRAGSIVGWGNNTYGETTPPSGTGFLAIAAGYDHSLALRADGSIVGWGYNYYGQATPPSGTGFVGIAAGYMHSLALRADGSIAGWGWNDSGQRTPPSGTGFRAIAAGVYHSLALKADGSIVAWGNYSTPPSGTGFTAIAAGYYHNLTMRADGSIVGWGRNDYGQSTPPSGGGFVAIAAGYNHSLALRADGSIVGWGRNDYGQATPPSGTGFTAITAGEFHSLALRADGSIVGWGYNNSGQATPPSGTGFTVIAAGLRHSLALKPDITPPSPDPMTWSVLPHVISPTSVAMTATTATDVSGAQYYFTCTTGGGHSSAWQDSAIYTDTGLARGATYSYTVKARDKSLNHNETASSAEISTTIRVYPVITSHPMPVAQTICSGDSAQYCVTANDTLPLNYQWLRDFNDIPGATSSCYTATQSGSYRCVVSNTDGSVTSNGASLVVVSPAGKAATPTPANNAANLPIYVVLGWSNGGRATSYDVYFGTTASLGPNDRRVSSTTSTTYDPGLLGYNRTYYWRIDSTNTCGTTTGDVWSFSTQPDPFPIITGHITTTAGAAVISVTLTTSDGLSCGNGAGQYVLPVPYGWSGTVTPSRSGYYFTPASMTYNSVTTGLLEQNYIAELIPVVIDSVAPPSGTVGTVLTLGGSNLGASPGRVLFGSAAAVVLQWTSTSITCIVPTGATTGNVVVERSDARLSNVVAFTVTVADILHVSNLADVTLQYGTRQYPFKTIAGAMMTAVNGTIVEVDDGIYTGPENRGLDTIGKSITLRSANGPASCIIDCNGLDRGFYIHDGEDANTVVDGFTIVNGYDGGLDTTVYGGGISCVGSSPTIHNCVIRNCSGIVGGISIDSGSPVIRNCVIANNSGFAGGILASSSSCTIESCTITGNTGAADMAGGIMYDYCDNISILNTILWNDWPCELLPWESTAAISYNCISGGYEGEGNISTDPLFADANNGDYHIKSQYGRWDAAARRWVYDAVTSSCIDAGDPTSDWTAELWPHGGRINIGAYGGTPEASMSASTTGSVADLHVDSVVDLLDYAMMASQWAVDNVGYRYPIRSDMNRDGVVDMMDVSLLAEHWLEGR